MLYQGIRQELGVVFRSLAEPWECRVAAGQLMPDQVHLQLSVPAKYSVSDAMGVHQGKARDP